MINWLPASLEYLTLPLLGGTGIALLAGPFGALMVWRRLAYFGDTLSHSGLLGVTLALAMHIDILWGVVSIAVLVALLLMMLARGVSVAPDTLLGLLSHTLLALGLLMIALVKGIQVDVLGFLYGDILALATLDLWIIFIGGAIVLSLVCYLWSDLLRLTLDPDLAAVEGVAVKWVEGFFLILLAVVIAIAMKMVGVLLITALLLIPAAAARAWAKTPEQMAVLASALGATAVGMGLAGSHHWDIPTGPAMVVAAAGLFLVSHFFSKI